VILISRFPPGAGWQAVLYAPGLELFAMRSMSDADSELVLRAQRGDRAAFEHLVRRHADRLYAVVLRFVGDRHEAEEVTQEAFIRAWRGIGRFKRDAQFFTWLYRIGINEAHRRAAHRPPAGLVSSLDQRPVEPPDQGQSPQLRAEHSDLRAALERAIHALDPDYRTPLILRDIEGLTTTEAATIMGLGEAAFKSRLHRARLAVRDAIDSYLPEDDA
jgi:RNA polymerase sigma-70 factor, ECF subfamily